MAEVVTSEDELNDSFRDLARYIGVFGTPENAKGKSNIYMMTLHLMILLSITTSWVDACICAIFVFESLIMLVFIYVFMHIASPIAMTSPVITTADKHPTKDSGSNNNVMQFVLPERFTDIDEIPAPTNRRVMIKPGAERIVAVSSFSGYYNRDYAMQKRNELYLQLLKDRLVDDLSEESVPSSSLPARSSDPSAAPIIPPSLKWFVAQYHPPFTLPFLRKNEIWIELNKSTAGVSELLRESQTVPVSRTA